jgi:uncharacterized membrane protein
MGILIIGVVSLVLLVWTLAWSLGAVSTAEQRRQAQTGEISEERGRTAASGERRQAA